MKALEAGDPEQIGKYRLLGRLGSGGMGRVFLGQSPGGRLVAVKLIRPDLAADDDFRVRFSREVKAARKVSGIFTAPVVDADPDGPQPWLVTAYVPGPSLADAVRAEGPLPVSSVLMLAAGLTEGLSALHAAGVVHRDLKPSNVLLASDGPRIIDFGVSRAADATPVTSAGMVVGSPGFMSPEQAGGHEVGPASDVFSLGSVLTFAATGEGPFGTGPGTVLLYRVQHLEPATGRLPAPLRPVVERCLAKDPRHRPSTDQILAELGSMRLAADWLPASIGQVPPVQAQPAAAMARSSVDAHTLTMSPPDLGAAPEVAVPPGRGPDPRGRPRYGRGRRLSRMWAVCALAVVAVLVVVLTLVTHWPATAPPPSRPSVASKVLGPSAVVKAFYTAINDHNWPKVWQLGGKNLGTSYPEMTAGYRTTARDVITSLTAKGTAVSGTIAAYQTTGALRTYQVHFVVRNGVITAGHQTLLGISYPSAGTAAAG